MKNIEFIIKNEAISTTEFNTNNSWGFAGGVGTSYILNGNIEIRIGTAYFRHLPSQRFTTVYVNGKRIIDQIKPLSIEQFVKIKNCFLIR